MNYYDLLQQQEKSHPDKLFFVVDHTEPEVFKKQEIDAVGPLP